MLGKIKSQYRRFRRLVKQVWQAQWKLRSCFVPNTSRRKGQQYLKDHASEMFFVLGTGRSGTQLLSDLLHRDGDISVFHEPNFDVDVGTMDALRRDKNLAVEYWRNFRSFEIYKRWKSKPEARLYGEVNGTIRFQAPAIRELYPEAKLFLVSRDGRGVVRSVMGWPQFYGPEAKGAYALEPLKDDPYAECWQGMTRFEKICWAWMDTNEFLMQIISSGRWMQLEKIASDYDYCNNHLLKPLSISISYENWDACVAKKSRNATSEYAFPSWDEWTEEQRDAFKRICGETMLKLGYKL